MLAVRFEEVSFAYGENVVIDKVSFEIEAGDYVGLIGPNGGGKSTLIKLCLGWLRPDEGEIDLFGTKVENFTDWRKIGYVPQYLQASRIPFPVTAGEILAMTGVGKERQEELLRVMKLGELVNRPVEELSGGQKQKVYIARALACDPQLLILDEPTTGVDAKSEAEFYDLLKNLNRRGKTIILASHDIATIAAEVSHLLCMNKKLVCHGKPREMVKNNWEGLFGPRKRLIQHKHS